MKKNLLIAVCLFISALSMNASAQSSTKEQTAAKNAIKAYIARQAKAADADEYTDARKIVFGDLDNDGDADAAVLYTLEGFGGGNFWVQTLAVFINNRGVFKFAAEESIGSKNGERSVSLKNINKGKIWVDAEYCQEPPQGLCDEPKKIEVYFEVKKNKLFETNVTAAS